MSRTIEACLSAIWRPLAVLLALIGLAAWAQAAEQGTKPQAETEVALPRRLTLVARAEPQLTQSELVTKLTDALKKSGATFSTEEGGVRAVSITSSSYATIERLVRDVGQSDDTSKYDVKMEPYLEESGTWQIDVADPATYLESLTLTTSLGGKEEKIELEPKSLKDKDWTLAFHSPGRWLLRLPDGRLPVKCVLKLKKDGAQVETKEVKLKQSELDRYWILTVRGYVGNEATLFEKLKDPTVVGTPFKAIEKPEMVSIILANMYEEPIGDRYLADSNTYEVNFERPGGIEPSRVWLLFPLTAQERDQNLQAIRGELKDDIYVKLSGLIHRNAVLASDEAQKLAPGASKPTWFEIPWNKDKSLFHRSFKLDSKDNWKRGDGTGVFGLLVYSFGTEDRPYRVNGTYTPVKKLENWPDAAEKAGASEPAAAANRP